MSHERNLSTPTTHTGKLYRHLFLMLAFGMALLFSRVFIMWLMGVLVAERPFTDDWRGILSFIRQPSQILDTNVPTNRAYWPPLSPYLFAVVGRPLQSLGLSDYYTVRSTSIVYEVLAWPMLWLIAERLLHSPRKLSAFAIAYIVAPTAIAATSLFGQDESIALCFILAASLLVLHRCYAAACLVCGLGAVCAKVYLLVPLVAIWLGADANLRAFILRGLTGLLPSVILYGYVLIGNRLGLDTVNQEVAATSGSLVDFTPDSVHSVSMWALPMNLLDLPADWVRYVSGGLALLGSVGYVFAFRVRRGLSGLPLVIAMNAMLLLVMLLFYHCDPEYYLMVLGVVIACTSNLTRWLAAVLLLSFVFAVNFFYGVDFYKENGGSAGKKIFVDIYDKIFLDLSPTVPHMVSLALVIAVNLWLLSALTLRLRALRYASRKHLPQ